MIILASKSAARQSLLKQAGVRFTAVPAAIDERALELAFANTGKGWEELAAGLAIAKARAVSGANPKSLVIGADQLLVINNTVLHKPRDRAAARAQLMALRGRTHSLLVATALVRNGNTLFTHIERADLTMRAFSETELDKILDLEGDEVLGSVGAYRLEGPGIRLFERVTGDYFTVLGLPLLAVLEGLRQHADPLDFS